MNSLERLREKPVYIYMGPPFPRPTESGSAIRRYTNIRAYRDLGFDVEIVYFADDPPPTGADTLGARVVHIKPVPRRPTLLERVAFRMDWPFEWVLNYSFPLRQQVRAEVRRREAVTPGAIHHFEYLAMASAAINYPDPLNSIFSSHDLESQRNVIVARMREERGHWRSPTYRGRRVQSLERAERAAVEQCRLVLAIARHEAEFMRTVWGCDHVELFPMSWPDETPVTRTRPWMDGGKLRLLHVGQIDALLGYYSLKFLFEEVFPRLAADELSAIEMVVVGRIPDTPTARTILELGQRYPQVQFVGFQQDIRPYYAATDLQVVGATAATGLRTRIIESFVYGLPVLSTPLGAEGVMGLEPGQNILLAADANSFAAQLIGLLRQPARLPQLAEAGQETYRLYYSRQVAAKQLAGLLVQYMNSECGEAYAARRTTPPKSERSA